jgi:hypothetical protein
LVVRKRSDSEKEEKISSEKKNGSKKEAGNIKKWRGAGRKKISTKKTDPNRTEK